MFLKRLIVLAAAVLLFIVTLIIYFQVSDARMEGLFRAEREKAQVDGLVLTTATPPSLPPVDTNSASATPATSAPAAASPVTPADTSTPAPSPAPATDTNSAPAPPASTRNDPPANHAPFLVLTSYRPDGAKMQLASALMGQVTSPAAASATNEPEAAPAATSTLSTSPSATPAAGPHPKSVEGSVIVLLYHQFRAPGVPIPAKFQWTLNQDVFASEMKYIHDNGYNVVSVADLLRFLKHEIVLPPRSVCITIDDGYKSAVVYAAPILKQYGYPWTFFIYPEFVTVAEGSGAVSWKDLLALQADGVDIESHSMTHPNLISHRQKIKGVFRTLSPEEYDAWLTNEIAGSKAILEQKMGKTINCLAYPYGSYNPTVEARAIAAGYEALFTVADNPVHSTTDIHSIGRYTITQSEVKHFESDLHQGALGLGDPSPAPGSTTSNPRPVIEAMLGYTGTLDPKSLDTTVYGLPVRHDFDPQTNTVRLYLARDLIQPVVPVNISVKDAKTGQSMVARWRFNYELPPGIALPHPPISTETGSSARASMKTSANGIPAASVETHASEPASTTPTNSVSVPAQP